MCTQVPVRVRAHVRVCVCARVCVRMRAPFLRSCLYSSLFSVELTLFSLHLPILFVTFARSLRPVLSKHPCAAKEYFSNYLQGCGPGLVAVVQIQSVANRGWNSGMHPRGGGVA